MLLVTVQGVRHRVCFACFKVQHKVRTVKEPREARG